MTENGKAVMSNEPLAPGQVENPPRPTVIEGPGRYVIYEGGDGGWVIARAVDICDTCKAHGCGEQADLIHVPKLVIDLAGKTPRQRLMSMLGKAAAK